ncbi:MAG: hypothetical protein AMQ22_01865 [Candidatus Methanofastidiosum methylothiophilum]|uniref:Uncharacterized protein n=1 Tax=Candidatus Methanofastidiosum methylothiophilum TaxID=1705564 RepID=A0A150IUG3_9EURY|nr:MAG: hypothetical protein AMQ22_01865 [Candidatus Methanofastidiosum methylthiophilus]
MVVELSETVTFLVDASQPTEPPRASTTALIGSKVLLFFMIGGESRVLVEPLTVNVVLPIWRMMIV